MWDIKKFVSAGKYAYAVVPEHPKSDKHGYVLAHRVIMENEIGRILTDDEQVHHIDGNGKNNSLENLQIIRKGIHQSMHAKQRYPNGRKKIVLMCDWCGIEFERWANQSKEIKKYNHTFCSRKCCANYLKK